MPGGQDIFSPHMHQERVMSKASETKITDIRNKKSLRASPFYNSKCHCVIILMPLWLSVLLSEETVTHNTTITSAIWTIIFMVICVCVCVLGLTELALLGLGHGRPVPGPLDGATSRNFSLIMHWHWDTWKTAFENIFKKGLHVHSWHTRTHGVVWRPHPPTKVLRRQIKIIKMSMERYFKDLKLREQWKKN